MIVLKLVFGLLFFLLGWIYLYKSNVVLNLNRIARDLLFNDRTVLLERKKLAIFFFCMSFVALYMGISSLMLWLTSREKYHWAMETDKYLLYMAMQDYCTERYANAIDKYEKVLKSEPNNLEAWKRLAYTYEAQGDKKKARMIWKKLLVITPDSHSVLPQLKSIEK